jgi:hypothetical protein
MKGSNFIRNQLFTESPGEKLSQEFESIAKAIGRQDIAPLLQKAIAIGGIAKIGGGNHQASEKNHRVTNVVLNVSDGNHSERCRLSTVAPIAVTDKSLT